MPAGVHLKSQLNARVSTEAHAILRHLQDYYGQSQSKVLEMLLDDKAAALGLDVTALVRGYEQLKRQAEG